MPPKQLEFPFVVACLVSMTACGSTEGATEMSAPGFEDSALDVYEIEVLPDSSALQSVTGRPDERFVMVNMLVFKDMAEGEGFEGLTGREAYQLYLEGLRDAQMAIDSRLIWAGSVQAQVVGSSDPIFQSMALLEYASPTAFLGICVVTSGTLIGSFRVTKPGLFASVNRSSEYSMARRTNRCSSSSSFDSPMAIAPPMPNMRRGSPPSCKSKARGSSGAAHTTASYSGPQSPASTNKR